MINSAQGAIINALRSVFTLEQIPTIYLTEVPAGFDRPSFYLELITPFGGEDITTHVRRYQMTWQIVYFPLVDAVGNEDKDDLIAMAMQLEELFGHSRTLTLPGVYGSDAVASIDGFAFDTRDGVGYGTLHLSAFIRRVDEEVDKLLGIELSLKTK